MEDGFSCLSYCGFNERAQGYAAREEEAEPNSCYRLDWISRAIAISLYYLLMS